MLKVEYDRYLRTYDLILETMVELHNKHMIYKKNFGRESVRELRKVAKKLAILHKELQESSLSSYRENRNNTKERLAQKRTDRAYRKENPLKRGRPRKHE
jgi:hypothetical protein